MALPQVEYCPWCGEEVEGDGVGYVCDEHGKFWIDGGSW